MRLKKEMIDYLAEKVADRLLHDGDIILVDKSVNLKELIHKAIYEDMEREDVLNEEIHDILEEYDDEIDIHHMNYGKLFRMVKGRIVRERNIIL